MRLRLLIFGLLAVMSCSLNALGQAPQTSPADIYANFVGSWVGTARYLKNGSFIIDPRKIEITETNKKDAMRWAYTCGEKGQQDFYQYAKILTLDPAKSEMTDREDQSDKERLRTSGLREFAVSGYGTFTATAVDWENGMKKITRWTFRLEKDKLFFQWETSPDGQTFKIGAVFSLTRELFSPSVSSSAK